MFASSKGIIIIPRSDMAVKALYAALLLLLVGMFIFCTFYLVSGYEKLQQWYFSLNRCFYNADQWSNTFFTPFSKQAGNRYAGIGMMLCTVSIYLLMRQWKKKYEETSFNLKTTAIVWYAAVAIVGIGASVWEWQMMAPAYDELFSAVNGAELHPLQTWSYYMLPNNHILFNLANGILFGWYGHLVGTGRFIAMMAYVCTLLTAYHWLTKQMRSYVFAFLAVLPIAFQFAGWSMSAQARGYECQLLCGWLAFTSLINIKNAKPTQLTQNTIANIIGFALIPSWFYFFVAQLLFAGGSMLATRKMLWQYAKHQLIIIAATFLFYLPAICFSGMQALSDNRYVQAAPEKISVFLSNLLSLSRRFICYCFSNNIENGILCYILFALPLLLFFTKKHKQLAGFYTATWMAYLLCSVFIKHTPFHRTLIVQFSITIALAVYTLWVVANYLISLQLQKTIRVIILLVAFVMPITALTAWEIRYDKQNVNFGVYSNDVNGLYGMHMNTISNIPGGSSVAFSEESFYFFYHCRRLGYEVSRCRTGQEQYFVKRTDEQLPNEYRNGYLLYKQGGEDYEIYRRNK